MLAHTSADLQGKRERALLLLGMAGAFRRSELIGLDVEGPDIHRARAWTLPLRRSKTDQEGQGHLVAMPCRRGLRARRCGEGMDRGRGRSARGRCSVAVNKAGRVGGERLSDGIGRQHRQGLCRQVAGLDLAVDSRAIRCGQASLPAPPIGAPTSTGSWTRRGIPIRARSGNTFAGANGTRTMPGQGSFEFQVKEGNHETFYLIAAIAAAWTSISRHRPHTRAATTTGPVGTGQRASVSGV